MDKSPDAFRTISEVAEWLGVQAHVLRFWESKFSQVKPVKRAGGRRYYRPADMELLGGIKKLLHDDGLTVKGVQKILSSEGVEHVSGLSPELCEVAKDTVNQMASEPEKPPHSDASRVPDEAPNIVPFVSAKADDEPAEKIQGVPQAEAISDSDPAEPDSVPVPEVEPIAQGDDAEPVIDVAPSEAAEYVDEVEPVQAPESATDPEIDQTSEQIIAPPPDVSITAADTPPASEKPILPSFLHRRAPDPTPEMPSHPVAESSPDTEPEPTIPSSVDQNAPSETPVPMIIDAADPPNEHEIPYSQGPLGHLASITTLSAVQISEIAPLAEELKTWLTRSAGTSAR